MRATEPDPERREGGSGGITAGGIALAALVAAGTALYAAGTAPPYPWNAWAFHALLAACTLYALLLGRSGER